MKQMKKWVAFLLALLLTLTLVACGAEDQIPDAGEADTTQTESTDVTQDADAPDTTDTSDATEAPSEDTASQTEEGTLPEDGSYTTKEDVALYLHLYGHLPDNFITKKEAEALGWSGGSLEPYAPGKCIGGSHFGNYEGLLPEGHTYTECDIDTLGASSRGAKRIVFSDDGLIYYTEDHYETFELLYGEE
jgi:hypothetical protein